MDNVKVCHMTSVHSRFDGRIFLKECTSLANYGYQVFLVSEGNGVVKENGVTCIGVGSKPSSRIKRMTSFSKAIYKEALNLNCDIYHFHDPELLPFAMKLKRKGKIVIFDSHEIYVKQLIKRAYLPSYISRLIAIVYGKYEAYVVKRIDGVITPCTFEGKNAFDDKCPNVTTVDNFPILSELYDKYVPDSEKYSNSVCYIGSLTSDRGVTNLIRAGFRAGCTVYLGGTFESEDYKSEVTNMPEYSCVKYMGMLGRDEVLTLIQHCQVGAAILRNIGQYNASDNMPTKVYEYMSLGVPVIITEAPFNREMINKYDFGLCVQADDIDAIAKSIRFLIDNSVVAREKGKNGRKAIKDKFNWDEQALKIDRFYRMLLDE